MLTRFLVIIILFYPFLTTGQSTFIEIENELAFQADVMVNASKAQHRIKAGKEFHKIFRQSLEMEESFNHPFDSLIWISKTLPEDQSFRIFSWQIKGVLEAHDYYAFLQLPDGKIFELKNRASAGEDFEYDSYDENRWFGQLYYDIITRKIDGDWHYYLFGYRRNEDGSKSKVFERINIEENNIVFGAEEFYKADDRHGKYRIILSYAAISNANISYDEELDLVIFDHLIPVVNPYEKNEMMMVPGGTYEGYELKKGKWVHKDRIFTQVYEKPPIPQPLNRDKDKDLFGRTKGK